jgi:hypothetical protein
MKKLFLVFAFLLFVNVAHAQAAFHTVTLTWTPSTSTNVGYNVYRSTTAGSYSTTPISPLTSPNGVSCTATLCTYVDQGSATNILTEGTTYFYVVKAVDLTTKGLSANSNEASGLIPIVIVIPNPPANLKITIQ